MPVVGEHLNGQHSKRTVKQGRIYEYLRGRDSEAYEQSTEGVIKTRENDIL
jgi:hypothetical protein